MQMVLFKETPVIRFLGIFAVVDSVSSKLHWLRTHYSSSSSKMSGGGTNMCDVVDIPGVAVKATFCSRVCVGGEKKAGKPLKPPFYIQQCSEARLM